jgi:hypothetical protein
MLVWIAVVTVFVAACVGAARAGRAMLAASRLTVRHRRGLRLVST